MWQVNVSEILECMLICLCSLFFAFVITNCVIFKVYSNLKCIFFLLIFFFFKRDIYDYLLFVAYLVAHWQSGLVCAVYFRLKLMTVLLVSAVTLAVMTWGGFHAFH